ncbi:acetyl-CoA hydrolase/transferase [Globomyces pollinis-pini]|nr:acetyl-CoA hydrolase/transferase [Globomyces pollinis-pini]
MIFQRISKLPHTKVLNRRQLFVRKGPPKELSAEEAVKCIQSNDRIYMHGVAAFPSALATALSKRSSELTNIEINHLHCEILNPCSSLDVKDSFFIDNYFIGSNQRKAVAEGRSSLIPCFLSELPKLMRSGIRRPDVAFLNVSPPDKHGFCSLGVEICTAFAAAETATTVIAQINPHMPRTHGQSFVHINTFDSIVHVDDPLPELSVKEPKDVEKAIGKYLAELIPDGATLQMGIGGIPNAVLACLENHKDLGIHTEMFSDGILPLIEKGVITNAKKSFSPNSVVTSFIMGSKKLYDFVDDNPEVLFKDIAIVNDPVIIAMNPKVTAINAAIEVDITGQVCADSVGHRMISGVGGQVDFERGAALSVGGIPTICLPSTTKDGSSTIVSALKSGAGVTTTRNHVHYVITEYGVANLFGKDLIERAKLLINIAHPKHRAELARLAFERYKVLI